MDKAVKAQKRSLTKTIIAVEVTEISSMAMHLLRYNVKELCRASDKHHTHTSGCRAVSIADHDIDNPLGVNSAPHVSRVALAR